MDSRHIPYVGSGPYCYANSFAMLLGERAPSTAVIEVATGAAANQGAQGAAQGARDATAAGAADPHSPVPGRHRQDR